MREKFWKVCGCPHMRTVNNVNRKNPTFMNQQSNFQWNLVGSCNCQIRKECRGNNTNRRLSRNVFFISGCYDIYFPQADEKSHQNRNILLFNNFFSSYFLWEGLLDRREHAIRTRRVNRTVRANILTTSCRHGDSHAGIRWPSNWLICSGQKIATGSLPPHTSRVTRAGRQEMHAVNAGKDASTSVDRISKPSSLSPSFSEPVHVDGGSPVCGGTCLPSVGDIFFLWVALLCSA